MNVQITKKKLKSEYKIDQALPTISTDREKLTEILLNLINNAVKYTPEGKIIVSGLKEKDGVHFIIKDTGIGISKENHKRIFERFYQVDSSYSRKAGGTGLGLALCSEFIGFLGLLFSTGDIFPRIHVNIFNLATIRQGSFNAFLYLLHPNKVLLIAHHYQHSAIFRISIEGSRWESNH